MTETAEQLRPCAVCLKPLEFGKARLMWGSGGTFRLCKAEAGCKKRVRARLRDLIAQPDRDDNLVDALERFLR